jgi:Zn-finger nucleic acid-binding protein
MTRLGSSLIKAMRQAVEGEKVRCPKCNSDQTARERRPDGNDRCLMCYHVWPSSGPLSKLHIPQVDLLQSALLQSQRELEACKQMLDVARKALVDTKWNINNDFGRCGTAFIDEALAKIGDGK